MRFDCSDFASTDPDRLLARWQALLAEQPHTHLRQAATALGVSEGKLLATRVGNGAVCLQPNLGELFDEIEQWRKIFIVTPNSLGVTIAIFNALDCRESEGQRIELLGQEHQIFIDTARVTHCYLFEDRDVHGYSLSLCWYDAQGVGMGKLFLRSRIGREFALPRLMQHAQREQSRFFNDDQQTTPSMRRGMPASEESHAPDCELPLADKALETERLAHAALTTVSDLKAIELQMAGGAINAHYRGPSPSFTETPGAVHYSVAGCKAHLRLSAVQAVSMLHHVDGRYGLEMTTTDGSLAITPMAESDSSWAASLIEGGI